MIEIKNVSKSFEANTALENLTVTINTGEIFGLVGTNGSGKSTLLRMISGVLKPDRGEILIDGEPVYENEAKKQEICFLADNGYTPGGETPLSLAKTYSVFYPKFDMNRFRHLLESLKLSEKAKLRTFSKGMKKQVSVLLGVCTGTKILLCDETFDGLDPVIRQTVKSLFATEMIDREFTPVIASHNLRELEDVCDNLAFLHNGALVYADSLIGIKTGMQKIQCVAGSEEKENALLSKLNCLKTERHGSMMILVVKGERQEIQELAKTVDPVYFEVVPLSLEEMFIDEMEVAGYDFKNIFK